MKILILSLSFILVSCNTMQSTKNQEVELLNSAWVLDYVQKNNSEKWIPKKKNAFVLKFEKRNSFSSETDCNLMGGEYTLEENNLSFGHIMATEMFCEDSEEQIYGSNLSQTQSYKITNKNTLELYSKNNTSKMVFKKQ